MMRWVAWTRDRFWLIPVVCTVLAFGFGLGLIALDRMTQHSLQLPFVISSGVEGARAVLSAIAGSMITFTGLVFSITIVTLQLTSSQFSPRVLRTFLRDRFSQLTLGIFIATFVYAMVVLRAIRSSDDQVDEFVPQLGVNLAFLFRHRQCCGLLALHSPHRPVHSSGDDHLLDRYGHPSPYRATLSPQAQRGGSRRTSNI